jgi:cell shape-determining protein MreC
MTPSWGVAALAFAALALVVRLLFPGIFLSALAPMIGLGNRFSAAGYGVYAAFADTAALAARNQKLFEENSALSAENRALLERQKSLNELLGDSADAPAGISAGVVARPPASGYDALVVAAGTDAGVALGMEAFGRGGVPVGLVTGVTPSFSRVTLFSAPEMRTEGWIGDEHAPVTLLGNGAGGFSAVVPRSSGAAAGDLAYLPGPGALPAGTVARVDGDAAAPMEVLRVVPALNPFSITWVTLRATGAAFAATTSPDLP